MANIFCPTKVDCLPGVDLPYANLTSEAADKDVYFGDGFGFAWTLPPLGSNWSRSSCLGVCTSTVSQSEADICAAVNNLICLIGDWGVCPTCTGDGNGSSGPPLIPRLSIPALVYYNSMQFCTVYCDDGTPFTWAINAGVVAALSQGLADRIAFEAACAGAQRNKFCLSAISQTSACVGGSFTGSIQATRPVTSWALISGAVPTGTTFLPLSAVLAVVAGVPNTAGSYTFAVRATLSTGAFMNKTYTVNILGISTSSSLPDATENGFYNQTLSATGGTSPYSYAVSSGALPAGLTLTAGGNLIGTPTVSGDFTFTIDVTDSTP